MPGSPYPPHVRAGAREQVETTTRTYAEIGAGLGVPGGTIGNWTRSEGWRRPPGAFKRTPVPQAQRAPAIRILAAGASHHDLAIIMGAHPETLRRMGPTRAQAAAARAGPRGPRPPLPAPLAVACAALTSGTATRREILHHAEQALACLMGQAAAEDAPAERKLRALSTMTAALIRLPDPATPPAGALADAPYAGPATYAETSALLEDFARRLAAFDAAGEADGIFDEPPFADPARGG